MPPAGQLAPKHSMSSLRQSGSWSLLGASYKELRPTQGRQFRLLQGGAPYSNVDVARAPYANADAAVLPNASDVLVLPDSEYLCPQCEGVVWTRAARREAVTCLECFRTYCSLSCCLKHWPLDDPELRCAPPPSPPPPPPPQPPPPPPRWRRLCEQWPACNFFAAGICAGKCTRSLCVQHIVGPCMQCGLEPLCEACLRMHCCETRDWTGCILSIADPSATGGVPQSADPSATGGVPQSADPYVGW